MNPGPQQNLPFRQSMLSFHDSTANETQLYKPDSIVGFGKATNELIIYMKGARDVNAVDKITISLDPTTTAEKAQETLIKGLSLLSSHPSNEVIKKVVAPTQGDNDYVHQFRSCTILYGTCCSGGGDTYTLQASAKAGSNVPLLLDAAAGSDSTVNLTEGSNITLTRNSASQVTIAANVPIQDHQINDHNLFLASWDVRNADLFPTMDNRGAGTFSGTEVGTGAGTSVSAFPISNSFGLITNLQRATADWSRVSWYNIAVSSLTAAAIAALGTGGAVKINLYQYTPSASHTTFNFSKTALGTLGFNAIANRLATNTATTTISLSLGDLFLIGYEYTVSGGSPSGTITGLGLQTTARFFNL